ncbi:MAG TPA: hypothetical protein VEB21_20195 [Terriglobales bacterium]|nr:hypothetical protein [Terriglobales bacterium]
MEERRKNLWHIIVMVLLPIAWWTPAVFSSAREEPRFAGAATSPEELADRLLAALSAGDSTALHALRVSREQYLELIVPGTIEPGEPLRQVSMGTADLFWRQLDQKSRDFGDLLFERYGGKRYRRLSLSYTAPSKHYGGYQAVGETRIVASDETGAHHTIASGWIAVLDGGCKWIGFEWDD